MRKIKLFFAATLLAASVATQAEPQLDIANELEARTLTLPSTEAGIVVVQGCTACPTFRVQTTAATEYQIGNEKVSLAQLRAAFAAKPDALILLKLSADRREVTLIFIDSYLATR